MQICNFLPLVYYTAIVTDDKDRKTLHDHTPECVNCVWEYGHILSMRNGKSKESSNSLHTFVLIPITLNQYLITCSWPLS